MDLTPLTNWLNTLGPWGIVIGMLLMLAPQVYSWVKARFPNLKLPSLTPTAPLVPLIPAPATPGPVLSVILSALQAVLAARNPGQDAEQLLVAHLAQQVGVQALPAATAIAPNLRAG